MSLAYCVIGSTADSGSVSEGSTPSRPALWSLRLSARMEDSQSSERGSIPLGTITASLMKGRFFSFNVIY